MANDIIRAKATPVGQAGSTDLPALIETAVGANAHFAYEEFFSGIDSPHTERAYRHAVHRFLAWCEDRELAIAQVRPAHVSEYIKNLAKAAGSPASKPTKKLHLAALRHFFDKLVVRHATILNPALSVRGPKHKVTEGKTPALSVAQAREVLAGIDTGDVVGLRDKAIVAAMIYTGVRVGAVAKLRRQDFYTDGTQWLFRFDEKGGKQRDIPCRHRPSKSDAGLSESGRSRR